MGFDKAIKSVTWPLAAVLCFFLGFCSQKGGTEYIREMRQMERVPKVSVNHIISGEVSIEGTTKTLKLPFVPATPKPLVFIIAI